MTTDQPLCPSCLLPLATRAQWADEWKHGRGYGCVCVECISVCWNRGKPCGSSPEESQAEIAKAIAEKRQPPPPDDDTAREADLTERLKQALTTLEAARAKVAELEQLTETLRAAAQHTLRERDEIERLTVEKCAKTVVDYIERTTRDQRGGDDTASWYAVYHDQPGALAEDLADALRALVKP